MHSNPQEIVLTRIINSSGLIANNLDDESYALWILSAYLEIKLIRDMILVSVIKIVLLEFKIVLELIRLKKL